MKEQDQGNKTFSRRALLIGAAQLAIISTLGGRLTWLQLVQGQRYKTLSDKNRINLKVLPPSRGVVVDRYGTYLAKNNQNFRILVTPEQTEDLRQTLHALGDVVPIDTTTINRVMKRAKKTASFIPIEVIDNISWDDMARVEANLTDLPGISTDVGEVREYPLNESTAHLIGYVGAVTKSDLSKDEKVLTLPGFKIGKTGIEKTFDLDLRGKEGVSEVEVNVRGREVRDLNVKPAAPGKTITLTLDAELQTYVQERLEEEKSASAIIMDVHTGAVYALASAPSFDPNLFIKGLSAETWEELLSDPGLPLNNKAVSGQYPPGSTFKMVTALAALEKRLIGSHEKVFCKGYYEYGNDRFHCWKRSGHGNMHLLGALEQSCDTYFYKIATEIGIDTLAEYAKMLGLGSKLGFELKEERPGLMPNKNWKMGYFGEGWKRGETVVASIGQGYIQTTPLQLATMTARLVNGGYAVSPWITGYVGREFIHQSEWPKLPVKKGNLDIIQKGMNRVMNGSLGTARKAQIPERRYAMGGKTGTAQVRRISMEEREQGIKNEDLAWRLRHHALFVGYAPYNNPRYACAVVVEHGGSGSASAAPIARDILYQAQVRNPSVHNLYPNGDKESQIIAPPRKPKRARN